MLDAGHGGDDSGAVYKGLYEKTANLATVFTLKYLMNQQNWPVMLTRLDDTRPTYADRTARRSADLFVSLHYDEPGGKSLLYYSDYTPEATARSKALGEVIARKLSIPAWSTDKSRFKDDKGRGRLYIDDVTYGPSLLWEVDSLDHYKNTPAYRTERCAAFLRALEDGWKEVFHG